ncbi:hypothetical protein T07_13972 [Trichinella nelsoni]|uniref:Uncharacterized protein n=1 Tax=Trichinella nelsoni TaxID=6336 RepID=A0A0V0RPJ8_9BILA|nr:hypothetical protein T07_13972 [Trichinella nelsoni]
MASLPCIMSLDPPRFTNQLSATLPCRSLSRRYDNLDQGNEDPILRERIGNSRKKGILQKQSHLSNYQMTKRRGSRTETTKGPSAWRAYVANKETKSLKFADSQQKLRSP